MGRVKYRVERSWGILLYKCVKNKLYDLNEVRDLSLTQQFDTEKSCTENRASPLATRLGFMSLL